VALLAASLAKRILWRVNDLRCSDEIEDG
jgi:hypothetical protein